MPSPACTVNGTSTTNGVNVPAASLLSISLADSSGVAAWSLTCIGTDDASSSPSLSVNTALMTASFATPSSAAAYVFRSVVNNGVDVNGRTDPTLTTTFTVYVLTADGKRLLALNETLEGNATAGWVAQVNAAIRSSVLSLAMGDANQTPTSAQLNARVIRCTGTLTAQRNLVLPLTAGATWAVHNATSGGFGVQAIGPSGAGVVVASASKAVVYCDGTNWY